MEVRVDRLKERPCQLAFDEPIAGFPILSELAAQEAMTFRGGLTAKLTAMLAGELVEIDGSLSCVLVLSCSRCLQPVEQPLDIQVSLTFTRQAQPAAATDGECELSETDVGLIAFEGETIDLRSPLEQEVLMALPQHPLCREDCAGLCPVCGADRNAKGCSCPPPQFHAGLAALKNFKVVDRG